MTLNSCDTSIFQTFFDLLLNTCNTSRFKKSTCFDSRHDVTARCKDSLVVKQKLDGKVTCVTALNENTYYTPPQTKRSLDTPSQNLKGTSEIVRHLFVFEWIYELSSFSLFCRKNMSHVPFFLSFVKLSQYQFCQSLLF